MNIWVVIPAYNEADSLSRLLPQIRKKGLLALIVDDGSSDKTYQAAKKYADVVLKNKINSGKGFSLKIAIDYLLENQTFDYLITMDADGQHSPEDLDSFIQEAASGVFFAIGNRMQDRKEMPKVRVVTNKFMSWLISRIAGQKIVDSQCGFRLMKREVAEKLKIKTKKFEVESEMLIAVSNLGYFIKNIPVQSIYHRNPSSKIRPFSDTLRFIKFLLALKNGKKPIKEKTGTNGLRPADGP